MSIDKAGVPLALAADLDKATVRAALRVIARRPDLTATERGDIAEALGLIPPLTKETKK